VSNNTLYKDGVAYQVLGLSADPVGFIEFINDVAQKFLIVLDGTKGWVINPVLGTITQIVDPDFPTPHCTRGAFIDGYICIAKKDTADIYNCDLNDPLTWTAGNFISAEMYPDTIQGLYKQANYVVAIGSQTIEYFYDAGASIGTPLARNPSAYHRVGTTDGNTVAVFEEQLIFIGNSGVGGRTVYKLTGFNLVEIASAPVRRWIEEYTNTINTIQAAFVIRAKGHAFFVLDLQQVAQHRTFVYDLLEGAWHEWADYTGTLNFPARWATDGPYGVSYLQLNDTGVICSMVGTKATDDMSASTTYPITMIATSMKQDMGTMNRKFANRFTCVCDVPAPNLTLSLQWSDDDYQTWSTPRSVPISDTMSSIQQLGSFRRRAWRITYSQPYPFRMEGAELLYNQGTA
jgi:hypothetical protein